MHAFPKNTLHRLGPAHCYTCLVLVTALWLVECKRDTGDRATALPGAEADGGETAIDGGDTLPASAVSEPSPGDTARPTSLPENEPDSNPEGSATGGADQLADAGDVGTQGRRDASVPDASVPGEAVVPNDAGLTDAGDYPAAAGGAGGVHSGGAAGTAQGGAGGNDGFGGDAGVSGNRADAGKDSGVELTFEIVHPVLSVGCAPCHDQNHQEGGRTHAQADIEAAFANIQLLGAGAIRALVSSRQMPPAGAPNGPLEQSQIDLIVSWVNAGAPR